MLRKLCVVMGLCIVLAACGTQAAPPYEGADEAEAIIAEANETATAIVEEAVNEAAENASFGPVIGGDEEADATGDAAATEEAAPTEEAIETEEVVATEEAVATEEVADTDDSDTANAADESSADEAGVDFEPIAAEDDSLAVLMTIASAANGEALFNQNFDTPTGTWMCITCHNVDSEEMKIGPGLLGIPQRANLRVEGQGPYTYIFNSIKQSMDYIVPGYENNAIMPVYEGVLSDAQIYDLVAYLMTLEKPE